MWNVVDSTTMASIADVGDGVDVEEDDEDTVCFVRARLLAPCARLSPIARISDITLIHSARRYPRSIPDSHSAIAMRSLWLRSWLGSHSGSLPNSPSKAGQSEIIASCSGAVLVDRGCTTAGRCQR